MKPIRNVFFLSAVLWLLIAASPLDARKVRSKLPVDSRTGKELNMKKGSQTIYADCPDSSDAQYVRRIGFSGYDKKASAEKESFFITNNSDRTLTGVSFYIVYSTLDSLQLHRRLVELDCSVKPGETEKFDIRSWDTQKSFRYYLSETPRRRRSTPYIVSFEPVRIYLKK